MKKILVVIIYCLLLCGCSETKDDKKVLTPNEIKEIMLNNEYKIIDVRTKEEYDSGHVKAAINIPYNEINSNIDIDKETIIFVYCKSGNRSNIAYNNLKKMGYTVYDLGAVDQIKLEKDIQ